METVKNIAAIIGCILSFLSLSAICTKAGRAWIKSFFKRHTQELQEENQRQASDIKEIKEILSKMTVQINGLSQVLKQQCRDVIKNIYYKYYKCKKIPLYERKTADATYKMYKDIWNGNSYAKILYNEIIKWEIDTVSVDHIEED